MPFFRICLITTISVCVSTFSIAEPIQLACYSSASAEAERLEEQARKFSDPDYVFHSLERAGQFAVKADECRTSAFGWEHIYVFDTDRIDGSTAQTAMFQRSGCNGYEAAAREVELSITPNLMTFTSPEFPKQFSIDRGDLRAGIGAERNFQCTQREADTPNSYP